MSIAIDNVLVICSCASVEMLFAIDEAWVTVEKVWEDRGLVAHPSFQSLKGSAKLHKLEINARMMGQAGRKLAGARPSARD